MTTPSETKTKRREIERTVCIRRGEWVRKLSRSLKHLTNIIGSIDYVNLGGSGLCSILVHADPDQLTVVDSLKAVACSANIFVHNVTTADRRGVVPGEYAGVSPRHFL